MKAEKFEQVIQPKKSSIYSVMSLTFGLMGLLTYHVSGIVLGPIGIIMGVIGWYKHERRIYYILGISIGLISILLGLFFGAFSVL